VLNGWRTNNGRTCKSGSMALLTSAFLPLIRLTVAINLAMVVSLREFSRPFDGVATTRPLARYRDTTGRIAAG